MNGLSEMIADLPRACDVGTKRDSQGHKHSWVGYKLHWDVADGGYSDRRSTESITR